MLEFIDEAAPSLQGKLPKQPQDLPHGLLTPPPEVQDQVAELDTRLLKEHGFRMNAEARQRTLEDWTLQYYFAYLGYDVATRHTAQGLEVLAVGPEEISALLQGLTQEQSLQICVRRP